MNKPTSIESVVAARKAMQPSATYTIAIRRSSDRRWVRARTRDSRSLVEGHLSRCHIVIFPERIIRQRDDGAPSSL
jgi:hypothetical protein